MDDDTELGDPMESLARVIQRGDLAQFFDGPIVVVSLDDGSAKTLCGLDQQAEIPAWTTLLHDRARGQVQCSRDPIDSSAGCFQDLTPGKVALLLTLTPTSARWRLVT